MLRLLGKGRIQIFLVFFSKGLGVAELENLSFKLRTLSDHVRKYKNLETC